MRLTLSRRHLLMAAASGSALLGAGPAQAQAARPLRVASKIDTEGALLGQLVLQVLEAGGIKTDNRLQLGNTPIVRAALVAGEIDLYPEYTGNGVFFFSDEKNPIWKNRQAGWDRVKTLDAEKNKLVWLPCAPANNTWAIAIRQDVAARHQLKSLADFGRWVTAGGTVKLAASAEFVERPDALPAFQAAYGFKLKQAQLLTLAGGDRSEEHTSELQSL